MAEGDSANAFKKLDKHKDVFSRAAQHVQGHAGSLASDQLLYLYARYKQVRAGAVMLKKHRQP